MRWVHNEAAKHITPSGMRKRIALAREHLRDLDRAGFGTEIARARENHEKLIEVLSERLERAGEAP
jgi:hypothetical protein